MGYGYARQGAAVGALGHRPACRLQHLLQVLLPLREQLPVIFGLLLLRTTRRRRVRVVRGRSIAILVAATPAALGNANAAPTTLRKLRLLLLLLW